MEPRKSQKLRRLDQLGNSVKSSNIQLDAEREYAAEDLPRELLQAVARMLPPHQRGCMRLVCSTWCRAVADDVAQLQLPLAALAPPPQWQLVLTGPQTAADAALRQLFSRFPHAHHLVLMHNMLLPPSAVQAALARLPYLCPGVHHVEVRDSVSWEQPAELAPLVAAAPGSVPGSGPQLRELTLTFLAAPDMQRVTRRWFSRQLERMVSPYWSVERLRVRWLMGETPRSFFTSRGFTRWANALAETAPHRLGIVQSLEFAWAELSDGSFERNKPAKPVHAAAVVPPLPPWILAPYHAALPPPPAHPAAPLPPPPPPQPFHNQLFNGMGIGMGLGIGMGDGLQAAAAMAAMVGIEHAEADAVFHAAVDGQMAEEEASFGVGPSMDGWNMLGAAEASATAALGLRGIGSGGGWDEGAMTGGAGAPRLGLPLAVCMFTNLKTLSLCCMACRAPADHLLRLLLRCRRLEKLSLVHHEAYASWPVRRPQPDLQTVLRTVVLEELGLSPLQHQHHEPAASAPGTGGSSGHPPASNTLRNTSAGSGAAEGGAAGGPAPPSTAPVGAPWWPADLSLRLRELQLPATPALLALLHLPFPALSRLETLDLQAIMATGYGGGILHSDRPMVGTARLVAALRAVRSSGASLRDLFLNNIDLSPSLLETIFDLDSLEQLLVFSGELSLTDRDSEPGSDSSSEDGDPHDHDEHEEDEEDQDEDPDPQGPFLELHPDWPEEPHFWPGPLAMPDLDMPDMLAGPVPDLLDEPGDQEPLPVLQQLQPPQQPQQEQQPQPLELQPPQPLEPEPDPHKAQQEQQRHPVQEGRPLLLLSDGRVNLQQLEAALREAIAERRSAGAGPQAVDGEDAERAGAGPSSAGAGRSAVMQTLAVALEEQFRRRGLDYSGGDGQAAAGESSAAGAGRSGAAYEAMADRLENSGQPGSAGQQALPSEREVNVEMPATNLEDRRAGFAIAGERDLQGGGNGASPCSAKTHPDGANVDASGSGSSGSGSVEGLSKRGLGGMPWRALLALQGLLKWKHRWVRKVSGTSPEPEPGDAEEEEKPSPDATGRYLGTSSDADTGAKPGTSGNPETISQAAAAAAAAAAAGSSLASSFSLPGVVRLEAGTPPAVPQFRPTQKCTASAVKGLPPLPPRQDNSKAAHAGPIAPASGSGAGSSGSGSGGSAGASGSRSSPPKVSPGASVATDEELSPSTVAQAAGAFSRAPPAGSAAASGPAGIGPAFNNPLAVSNEPEVAGLAADAPAAEPALAPVATAAPPPPAPAAAAAPEPAVGPMMDAAVGPGVMDALNGLLGSSRHGLLFGAMAMTVASLSSFLLGWTTVKTAPSDTPAANAAAAVAASLIGQVVGGGGGFAAVGAANGGTAGSGIHLMHLAGVAAVAVLNMLRYDMPVETVRRSVAGVRSLRSGATGLAAIKDALYTAVNAPPPGNKGEAAAESGPGSSGPADATMTDAPGADAQGTLGKRDAVAAAATATAAANRLGSGSRGSSGSTSDPGGSAASPHDEAVARRDGGAAAAAEVGSDDLAGMVSLVYYMLRKAEPALRSHVAALEEGQSAVLRALCSGVLRPTTPQETTAVASLLGAAKLAETLDAITFAAHVAARLVGCDEAVAAEGSAGPEAACSEGELTKLGSGTSRRAAVLAAAAAVDPEAAVEAFRVARPAGRLRCIADEGALLALNLAGLTRLTRLRKLCLDLSTENRSPLPVGSAIRVLLRSLPSLESLHVTDQYPHAEDKSLASLGLPAYGDANAGPTSLYDSGFNAAAAANRLTSLTVAARQARRVMRPYAADSSGALLAPQGGGADVIAAPHLMALLLPPDRTALSGALCLGDLLAHWGSFPRNLLALCLHRVRMLAHSADVPAAGHTAATLRTPAAPHEEQPVPKVDDRLPALTIVRRHYPMLPPLLQHLWLSNVTLAAPMDFAGVARELLAMSHRSGGLQTLVIRHCFVVRQKESEAPAPASTSAAVASAATSHGSASAGSAPSGTVPGGGAGGGGRTSRSADVTAVRVLSAAMATMAEVGNGGFRTPGNRFPPDGWDWFSPELGSVMSVVASYAASTASTVVSAMGGPRLPQRLVLGEEDVSLLSQMKSLRTLALDSCLRLEDVGRLTALSALRTLALNPNVVASEEARARLDLELGSRSSPALLAAIMRLAPLTGLRGLWLPDWAGSRSALLQWQSQLAAAGPSMVALRVLDHDNLWRLSTPAGCPDVEDSLQWWQAEVWNTI